MKTKDLIKQLQALVDAHEPEIEIFGEHEIVIDSWKNVNEHVWQYEGFSLNIEITPSSDGVYPVLHAKESWS